MTARGTKQLLEGVRGALEESLLALTDREVAREVTERLREAIAALNRRIEVEPRDAEALDELDGAAAAMRAARSQLTDDEDVARRIEGAERWLVDASEKLRAGLSRQPAGPSGAQLRSEMLASVGAPRAHWIEVPAPRVLAREDAASEAQRARAALEASPHQAGEIAQIRAIARDCFEDIGSLGSLRRLYDHEPWGDAGPFEQRLLDNLDALVSLERPLSPGAPSLGLVEQLFAYATEWTVPDYGRTFALAFTLCCLSQEAAMRWVALALRRSHPGTYGAFVDALSLGSNEAIDRTLAEMCSDDDPDVVAVALAAMARRGRPDMRSTVLLLMRPSAGLQIKAIDLAGRLPPAAVTPLLVRLMEGSDPVAAASAAATLTTLGDLRGPKHLRELLARRRVEAPSAAEGEGAVDEERAARAAADAEARRAALEALCLLGDPVDRELVAAEAIASRDPERSFASEGLLWLGFHGAAEHVPVLAAALKKAAVSGATFGEVDRLARALERIGGGERLPRLGEVGREGFDEKVTAWALSFEERRPKEASRLRYGRAWTAVAIVDELLDPKTKQGERPALVRELALVTKRAGHVDVAGWAAAQVHDLKLIRDTLSKL